MSKASQLSSGPTGDVSIAEVFGAKLKHARVKAGLKQAELAAKADLQRSYVVELEGGDANVTLKTMAKLAEVLGVDVRDFLPESKAAPVSPTALAHLCSLLEHLPDRLAVWHQQEGELLQELRSLSDLRHALASQPMVAQSD